MRFSKLEKARTLLIVEHPFFASLMLGLPLKEDSSIPTFATNGKEIRYNPELVQKLEVQELLFILAHEVMHCVFTHMTRRGERTPKRWNIAGDYIINEILINDRVGSMPTGDLQGLHDPSLVQRGGGTTEGVYNLLSDENELNQPGQPGGALDEVEDMKGADELGGLDASQFEDEMKVKIVQGREMARVFGKLSKGLERLVNDLVQPKVEWREVLRQFLSTKAKNELSFARPNRRFMGEDFILPSLNGQKLGHLAVAVDCSGSVNPIQLALFSADINKLHEDLKPEKLSVLYFDSEVIGEIETYGPHDSVELKMRGGGGTAFSPIFKALEKEEIVACVVLTDLDSTDFGPVPSFPVLWVTTLLTKAPFGEITQIKGNL